MVKYETGAKIEILNNWFVEINTAIVFSQQYLPLIITFCLLFICCFAGLLDPPAFVYHNYNLNPFVILPSNNSVLVVSLLEVTDDVVVGESLESKHKGEMANW